MTVVVVCIDNGLHGLFGENIIQMFVIRCFDYFRGRYAPRWIDDDKSVGSFYQDGIGSRVAYSDINPIGHIIDGWWLPIG